MPNKIDYIEPKRQTGLLRKTHGKVTAQEFLFLDTETHIKMLSADSMAWPLRLGVVIYVKLNPDLSLNKRLVLSFKTIEDFIVILETYCKGNKTVYICGHNIKFDIMVLNLPMTLEQRGYKTSLPIINERLFIWRVKLNKARAIFIDTANYGVISVEQIGKDLGYPKLDVDFTAVSETDLITYCRRDTEIVETFMLEYLRFIHNNNLGGFRMSLASQSLTAWRQRFMKRTVVIHNDTEILELERKAYHGGHTECYMLGKLPVDDYYYLDVNSMYPYIMKTAQVPVSIVPYTTTPNPDNLANFVKAHYIIADVLLDTDIPAYSILEKGKLIFPIGRFRTVLHHRELTYALAHNHVVKCYKLVPYESANIFGDYVDFFYNLKLKSKLDGNLSWTYLCKLLLNSLYGKFGQTGVHQKIEYGPYEHKIERFTKHRMNTDEYDNLINWFGTQISETKYGESTYSSPAIAGCITAEARMLLWSYIEKAGRDNVFYTDTDSLITNHTGYLRLSDILDNNAIGKLKLEEHSTHLIISGAKDYEFGSNVRHKGIPHKAIQTERNKWRCLQFPGLLGWFNTGGNTVPVGKYVNKSRISSYSKGIVDYETGKITPFKFTYVDS